MVGQLWAVVMEEVVAEVESATGENNITTGITLLSTSLGPADFLPSIISKDLLTSSLEMAVVNVVVPTLVLCAEDHRQFPQA